MKQWYKAFKGKRPRNSPGQTMPVDDLKTLETLLFEGMNRATVDKSAIKELGFGLHVWNQRPDGRSTRVHIQCGGYSDFVGNYCLVTPPSEGDAMERLLSEPTRIQLLECMTTAWDPDWGVVSTNRSLDLIAKNREREARVGWMTYISRRRGTVPPLPAPVRIQPVGSLGMLIILTPERFTASNPEHIALGRRVRELLERANVLSPRST
ncbi:Imm52 family immunity protein [Stigmatella sp. ncwal1]|uniref:Imm52 family immunity protein n=1 Tax=Stigmatella ashevillensis TaxID=2995309 RepID=A0ABT5D1A3_9BACT|nr:Imm52 family immunity protein [Stigmatella ashevillena]MDC0707361.1 Imm52 family immunity protein [Stigmatella ashevillena]